MNKEKLKAASLNLLIIIIASCLILYIYNPYRIESTIEYNMTRYFEKHEKVSENILKISEKLQPMYDEQYEKAMGMVEAESEEEAMKIAEEVQKMGIEMEETFMNSAEYTEILKLDEEVIQIQTEINHNLDQLDSEKKEELLENLSKNYNIEKGQLVEMLTEE